MKETRLGIKQLLSKYGIKIKHHDIDRDGIFLFFSELFL